MNIYWSFVKLFERANGALKKIERDVVRAYGGNGNKTVMRFLYEIRDCDLRSSIQRSWPFEIYIKSVSSEKVRVGLCLS